MKGEGTESFGPSKRHSDAESSSQKKAKHIARGSRLSKREPGQERNEHQKEKKRRLAKRIRSLKEEKKDIGNAEMRASIP